jgi:hypothetical protein
MGSARVVADSPVGVLACVRAHRAAAEEHEAAILRAVADWADLHPPETIDDAAYVEGTEGEVALEVRRAQALGDLGSPPDLVSGVGPWPSGTSGSAQPRDPSQLMP